jgi:hypothetical protein
MATKRWPFGSGPSLINDCTYQVLTDQNERDIARLAEHNRQVRLALSGRVSWWRRLMAWREQRIHTAAEPPAQHSTQHSTGQSGTAVARSRR